MSLLKTRKLVLSEMIGELYLCYGYNQPFVMDCSPVDFYIYNDDLYMYGVNRPIFSDLRFNLLRIRVMLDGYGIYAFEQVVPAFTYKAGHMLEIEERMVMSGVP